MFNVSPLTVQANRLIFSAERTTRLLGQGMMPGREAIGAIQSLPLHRQQVDEGLR
jgi:hypothetical protein